MVHTRQTLIRRPTLFGLRAGLTQRDVCLGGAYMRPSSNVVTHPFATDSKFRKRRLQKTDHRLHVTHRKVCMFKPDSHGKPPMRPAPVSRRPFKNHGGRPNNNTNHPCSEAAILTRFSCPGTKGFHCPAPSRAAQFSFSVGSHQFKDF